MNDHELSRAINHFSTEIIANKKKLFASSQDVRANCGYFFLLTNLQQVSPSDVTKKTLQQIFFDWKDIVTERVLDRWSIMNGKLALLHYYYLLQSVNGSIDHKYISSILNDLEHDIHLGRIRKTGLLNGMAGTASLLLCLHQVNPSKQIESILNKCITHIAESLTWDQFGLSISQKYDPDFGDELRPLHNSIDLDRGSAGLRYLLFQLAQTVASPNLDLSLLSKLLFNREEKLYGSLNNDYPDYSVIRKSVQKTMPSSGDLATSGVSDYYHGRLGVLAVNAVTNALPQQQLRSRVQHLNLSNLSIRNGWASTMLTSTELMKMGVLSDPYIHKMVANFETTSDFDLNESVGVMIAEIKNHLPVQLNFIPALKSGFNKVNLNVTNDFIFDHLIHKISPCVQSALKKTNPDPYKFFYQWQGLDAHELLDELHRPFEHVAAVTEERKIDKVIMKLRGDNNIKQVRNDYHDNFMNTLEIINLPDERFRQTCLRFTRLTVLLRSVTLPNLQDDTSAEGTQEEVVTLVSLAKRDHPEVKVLNEFDLLLSCVRSDDFDRVEDIIYNFSVMVDIEDDEEVRNYFLKNCRKILEDAMLEGWIETNVEHH